MCYILESLLPNDYFCASLIGMRTDQAVLVDLVQSHLPKLSAHFVRCGFDVGVLVPSWVMSLFVGTLPVSGVVPVWDYLLTREPQPDPSPVPLALCVAILKMHSEALLGMDDAGEMLVALTKLVQSSCDGQRIVKLAHDLKVTAESVRMLRRKHRGRLAREAALREAELR